MEEHNVNLQELINCVPPLLVNYELINKIAGGGNSEVWAIKDKNDNFYACKIPDEDLDLLIMQEAKVMSQLSKYPNTSSFLTFYGLYSYNNKLVMVSELFNGSELSTLIQSINNKEIILTEAQILHIIKLIFQQLNELHKKGFNHGDFHAGNILYNKDNLVIIDIGNVKYYPNSDIDIASEEYVTISKYWLKAMNLRLDSNIILQKKDIFAAGEIIYNLMGHQMPIWDKYIKNPETYKLHSQYPIIDNIVNSTMNIDITERPSADDILTYINTL